VTVHAPGQLVGYPILDLQAHRPDVHWYLRSLEEALVRALDDVGVQAERNPGLTGVWVGPRKIASIGVHVKRWVTLHGFALNVTTDLTRFDVVIPCGIQGVVMTSVARELPASAEAATLWERTREAVIQRFGEVFQRAPMRVPHSALVRAADKAERAERAERAEPGPT
jgi:lipoate-protein ligase B